MSPEELAAIRERRGIRLPDAPTASEDIAALLAEIERLRGERDTVVFLSDAAATREAAQTAALQARLDKVRALADSMDREAPKPQPGGFIADAIRQALDGNGDANAAHQPETLATTLTDLDRRAIAEEVVRINQEAMLIRNRRASDEEIARGPLQFERSKLDGCDQ